MEVILLDFMTKMSTMPKHNRLLRDISFNLKLALRARADYDIFTDTVRLAYFGNIQNANGLAESTLIWVDENFQANRSLEILSYVEPDLMLFYRNRYIEDRSLIIGAPDLIVEIWSERNSDLEQAAKRFLYSTSQSTEHWYLTQNSNTIERWLGKTRLPDASLSHTVITNTGLTLDLSKYSFKVADAFSSNLKSPSANEFFKVADTFSSNLKSPSANEESATTS
ncbi:MAG: Uma2 family endonuclease [Turicibacter sp.]|nr:Uma2 family endonuclease [Turicibacter sp.]